MARFKDALESNPAPSRLGDVLLRYEPSMLIGETPKSARTLIPTMAWVLGVGFLLLALAALLSGLDVLPVAALIVAGALALAAAVWTERFEGRQRRFVVNFGTVSLRLDFSTPISGQPRTLVVPFDSVQAVELETLEDGERILTVDFAHQRRVFREVLAAAIDERELEAAERMRRVLHGAFGLGQPPSQDTTLANDESSFEAAR